MEGLTTFKKRRKELEMPGTVDYGYADSNEQLMNVNIGAWALTGASGVDYSVSGGYGSFESSNGKRVGIFENVQSKTLVPVNYNDRQSIDMQDRATRLEWIIQKSGLFQSDAIQTMFASEMVLRRDWDTPEEDEAWADL